MKSTDLLASPTSQNTLRRAIAAFVRAAIAEDNRGGQDPDDWPAIERRMKRTHARLDRLLRTLPIPLNPQRRPKP